MSLSFQSIVNYINDDNINGLKGFLENRHVQVDDRDENGTTALMVAATNGKLSFIRELINHGADVSAEDNDNWTALLNAAKEGYTDVCEELIQHGADIEQKDMAGWTSLLWACYKGRTETANFFMEKGANVNASGTFHISCLLWAAGRGYLDITKNLIHYGAKVNVGDKYGTTALTWACRKGHTEIVDVVLKAGANVDTAGMYSWTPLLVATNGNYIDIVKMLLGHRPNVNALDKDGCTALTIACKEGFHEIATALLNSNAYVNVQDRSDDTNLIHAAKAGHRAVVEALLKKYADANVFGRDRKTALYWAVEKGNAAIVKLLLSANPDLEISTKDGDTPLLKAVRNRNSEIVQILLDKKARVNATDKLGDTALHIAMRARSKGIVEILLRNPKNSQLLYRPNRSGETPYNIDINSQKTILGQVFGARRLNRNEDNENMLGYDLYSSALADILSEPSLSMPITVGLYAKWGSGKSFLLNKLREEMKSFARQWIEPAFQFSSLLLLIVVLISLILGVTAGLALQLWVVGVTVGVGILVSCYTFLFVIWFGSQRYDWEWPYNVNIYLGRKLNALKLVLQVMFCHPPGSNWDDGLQVHPIRFYFTDSTKVSSTGGGENAVVQMVGSLFDAIENNYGIFPTRLYRAFKPKSVKSSSPWRWRRLCCLPYFVIFLFSIGCTLTGIVLLTVYTIQENQDIRKAGNFSGTSSDYESIDPMTLQALLITIALLVGIVVIANLYTLGQMMQALIFSQRRQVQRAVARLEAVKSEGYLQILKHEVNLMREMTKCLDAFTRQQTRLVVIVDGLDSCEQNKVLHILDAVHMLYSDPSAPFITILVIDPHVVIKAVELNMHRVFSETNIGGHDYLRNMVHLPFFLQNSGLRKVKIAQQTAHYLRAKNDGWLEVEDSVGAAAASAMSGVSPRKLSTQSEIGVERIKHHSGKMKKLKASESIASSIGSNLNKVGGAHDLTKMLLTDDYFSDVNPRSMRRLMNVVYITGRLLKSFHIDFNWYHLASWVNITEQWPYRTSWIILHYETHEDSIEDSTSLKILYDKVRPQIPNSKEVEPLLEMDRDEKKFDVFLSFHKTSLHVTDLKIFMPFTINLDPYLRKVIKEELQNWEEMGAPLVPPVPPLTPQHSITVPNWGASAPEQKPKLIRRTSNHNIQVQPTGMYSRPGLVYPQANIMMWPYGMMSHQNITGMNSRLPGHQGASSTILAPELHDLQLSKLGVEGVCEALRKLEGIDPTQLDRYCTCLRDNNISGRVLTHCDLDELKKVVFMNFGDWELFKMMIVCLKEQELLALRHEDGNHRNHVRFAEPSKQKTDETDTSRNRAGSHASQTSHKNTMARNTSIKDGQRQPQWHSSTADVLEKQVTLEEQAICGALQTLNEEAFEDVLEEKAEEEYDMDIQPSSSASSHHAISDSDILDQELDAPSCGAITSSPDETEVLYLHTSSPVSTQDLVSGRQETDMRSPSCSASGEMESGLIRQRTTEVISKPPLWYGEIGSCGSLKDFRSSSVWSTPGSPVLSPFSRMHSLRMEKGQSYKTTRTASLRSSEQSKSPRRPDFLVMKEVTKSVRLSPSCPSSPLQKPRSISVTTSPDDYKPLLLTLKSPSLTSLQKNAYASALQHSSASAALSFNKIKQKVQKAVSCTDSTSPSPVNVFEFQTMSSDQFSDESDHEEDNTLMASSTASPVLPDAQIQNRNVIMSAKSSETDSESIPFMSVQSTPLSPTASVFDNYVEVGESPQNENSLTKNLTEKEVNINEAILRKSLERLVPVSCGQVPCHDMHSRPLSMPNSGTDFSHIKPVFRPSSSVCSSEPFGVSVTKTGKSGCSQSHLLLHRQNALDIGTQIGSSRKQVPSIKTSDKTDTSVTIALKNNRSAKMEDSQSPEII